MRTFAPSSAALYPLGCSRRGGAVGRGSLEVVPWDSACPAACRVADRSPAPVVKGGESGADPAVSARRQGPRRGRLCQPGRTVLAKVLRQITMGIRPSELSTNKFVLDIAVKNPSLTAICMGTNLHLKAYL